MAGLDPISNFILNTANQAIAPSPRRPLILAQGLSSGSFISGQLVQNIANDQGTAAALCGAGSIGQIMIDAFKQENPFSPLDVIIVSDNGSGVAATGTVVFTATPTASGTLNVIVGSYINNNYQIPVTTASTATTLATSLVVAITADLNSPVTAANTAGSVTLTAKNKGTEGNSIGIKVEGSIAGVSVALTAFASGTTDPVLTGVLTQINEARYDIITELAFLNTVNTHLTSKFNASNQILDGIGFVTNMDTYANLQTALAPSTLASQVIVYICNKKVANSNFVGGALLELNYAISARIAALRALRFVPNSILNSFMVAGNDRGGPSMAAVPYQNMSLNNVTTIPIGTGFLQSEAQGLGNLGGTTISMDSSGVVAVTNILWLSCYKAATPSAIGSTYSTLNRNDIATTAREYIFTNMKTNFAQSALTETYIGDLQIQNMSVAQLLEYLRKHFHIEAYFLGDTLYVGSLVYSNPEPVGNVNAFIFQQNIISSELTYQRKDDVNLSAVCESINTVFTGKTNAQGQSKTKQDRLTVLVWYDINGAPHYQPKQKNVDFPENLEGERRKLFFPLITDAATLAQQGLNELQKYYYTGFKGSFTTFATPSVTQGDTIFIQDLILPDRNGFYIVKGVKYTGGVSGHRQIITLDYLQVVVNNKIQAPLAPTPVLS